MTQFVKFRGWTETKVFICSDKVNSATETLAFVVSMKICNPYGLLTAGLYGILPFSGFLTAGFLMLDVFFAFLLIRYRHHLLSLHRGIALIFVMGTDASAVCALTDERNGRTGFLSLSDDGFGCGDIEPGYYKAR